MARNAPKPAGDATGRQAAKLQKEHQAELERRQNELSMITEAEETRRETEVVDYTDGEDEERREITRQPSPSNMDPDDEGQFGQGVETDVDGYYTYEGPNGPVRVKTNDTEVVGSGSETPGEVPGEAHYAEIQRAIVDRTELEDPSGERGKFGSVLSAANMSQNEDEVDYTGSRAPVRDTGVQRKARPTTRTIQVNQALEQVTIGAGKNFDFEPGRSYKVPAHIADHLEEKGLLYH